MNYSNIPDELRRLDNWVCSYDCKKIPMRAYEPIAASSTDPATWSDFETALSSVESGYYDYLGFVFSDNGYIGIDIDCGYDEDGFLTPLAIDIIERCKSYTEKSKSGRGVHIIVKGDLPFKGKNNLAGVEIYKTARFFILTGDIVLYHEIEENQDALNYIVCNYFKEERENGDSDDKPRIYAPSWNDPVTNGKIRLRPSYPTIKNGNRNLSLTSLAGSLHNQGYSKKQIYEELRIANKTACKPPLSDSELQSICNSISRYRR